MLDQPRPTAIATATRRPAQDGPPAVTESLPMAVDAGLQCLRNLALVDGVIAAGDLTDAYFALLTARDQLLWATSR
jgi:hypothetical protein